MRVLFIGNSHTFFNDMPELFARFCAVETDKPEITMLAYPGKYLDWHMKEYFAVRFNILYGGYDYCIIQQGAHPFPDEASTFENAKRIIELCNTVNTVPIVTDTWAEKAHPEHQDEMNNCYIRLARETGALLSPVGIVWSNVQQNHPDIELYWQDGEHASVYGDYLCAAVHYGIVLNKTEIHLPNTGLDFFQDMEVGQPFRAIEDPALTRVSLDRVKTGTICQEVSTVLTMMQG